VECLGQDVLEKASDEFECRQGHGLAGMVFVGGEAKGNLSIMDGDDAVVGDGDSVHVARQVLKDFLRPLDGRFAVDDPVGLEYVRGEAKFRGLLFEVGDELAAEKPGKGLYGYQETLSRGRPVLFIGR